MSLLSDIGGWLKNTFGDAEHLVGIHNAPAQPQSQTPAQQPSANHPIQVVNQPQQIHPAIQAAFNEAIQNQQANPQKASIISPKSNLTHPQQLTTNSLTTNPLTAPNPLVVKAPLAPVGAKPIRLSPATNPYLASAGKSPASQNHNSGWSFGRLAHDITHNPVTNFAGTATKDTGHFLNNELVKPAISAGEKSINTGGALLAGIGGLGDIGYQKLIGNEAGVKGAESRTQAAMDYALNHGIGNKGAFINANQAQNADLFGNSKQRGDLIKPIISGAATDAPYVVPFGRLAEGASLPVRALVTGGANSLVGVGSTAGQEYATTGQVNPKDVFKSGLISGGLGAAFPVGGELARRGANVVSDNVPQTMFNGGTEGTQARFLTKNKDLAQEFADNSPNGVLRKFGVKPKDVLDLNRPADRQAVENMIGKDQADKLAAKTPSGKFSPEDEALVGNLATRLGKKAVSYDERQAGLPVPDILKDKPYSIGIVDQSALTPTVGETLTAPARVLQGNEAGFVKNPFASDDENFGDQYAEETAQQFHTPEEYRQHLIDTIWNTNKKGAGVNTSLIPDEVGGGFSKRVTESNNSPFYQAFYKEFGHKPTKQGITDLVDDELKGKHTILSDSHEVSPVEKDVYNAIKERDDSLNHLVPKTQSKGVIIKETPVRGGRQDVIRIKKNPETGKLEARKESIVAPKAAKMDADTYANVFNVSRQEAEKALKENKPVVAKPIPEKPIKLTPDERQDIINNSPYQQTRAKVNLSVPEGNIRGAIAQAEGLADKRLSLFAAADKLARKLDEHDKQLLSERADPNLKIEPDDPELFDKAARAYEDAFDFSLAVDRAGGSTTLRYGNGKYTPLYIKATDEQMDKLGIPLEDRYTAGKYRGFRDTARQFRSYTDANRVGLSRMNESPLADAAQYALSGDQPIRGNLLFNGLKQAAPQDVADIGYGRDAEGAPFTQAAGNLPFNASRDIQHYLAHYKGVWVPRNPAARVALKALEGSNKLAKTSIFLGTPFHYANLTKNFLGLTLGSAHPGVAARGMGESLFGQAGGYGKIISRAEGDGTIDWIRKSGTPLRDSRVSKLNDYGRSRLNKGAHKVNPLRIASALTNKLNEFSNTLVIALARAAKERGIDPTSELGVALGKEYGNVVGHINEAVRGINPNEMRITGGGALAQNWTRTQLGLIKDALDYSTVHATGKRGVGLFNPGDVARGTVLGARAVEAAFAIIGGMVATGAFPTMKQAFDEAGLNPNNPVPNINTRSKNPKGENWTIDLPTDPIGLSEMAVTDPKHFAASRYSPFLSSTADVVTNQNWNGLPIRDTSAPGSTQAKQAAVGFLKNLMPIAAQNATNPDISIKQGLVEDVGGRYKVDPNSPQAKANANYWNLHNQLVNDLNSGNWQAIDPNGQLDKQMKSAGFTQSDINALVRQYNNTHPTNTTDPTGTKYPEPWTAYSAQNKLQEYVLNNQKTGDLMLSPSYYIDKKLAQVTPGYPQNPLFNLNSKQGGTILGENGQTRSAPQSLVALIYNAYKEVNPSMAAQMLAANGGSNGWLSQYEGAKASYDGNYQQNMTSYLKSQGATQQYINQYWQQHPSTPSPFQYPAFSQSTQNIANTYFNLLNNPNTAKQASAYLDQNSDVLNDYFNKIADYTHNVMIATDGMMTQDFPKESDQVKQAFLAMPSGATKADKKAESEFINSHPELNQYLADVALYELSKGLAQNTYVNPAKPELNEGQLLNQTSTGSKLMKDVADIGSYDLGYNPTTGQYSFMQNGTFPGGSQSSNQSEYSKKNKVPYIRMRTHRMYSVTPKHGLSSRKLPGGKHITIGKHPIKSNDQKKIQLVSKPGRIKINKSRPTANIRINQSSRNPTPKAAPAPKPITV